MQDPQLDFLEALCVLQVSNTVWDSPATTGKVTSSTGQTLEKEQRGGASSMQLARALTQPAVSEVTEVIFGQCVLLLLPFLKIHSGYSL